MTCVFLIKITYIKKNGLKTIIKMLNINKLKHYM